MDSLKKARSNEEYFELGYGALEEEIRLSRVSVSAISDHFSSTVKALEQFNDRANGFLDEFERKRTLINSESLNIVANLNLRMQNFLKLLSRNTSFYHYIVDEKLKKLQDDNDKEHEKALKIAKSSLDQIKACRAELNDTRTAYLSASTSYIFIKREYLSQETEDLKTKCLAARSKFEKAEQTYLFAFVYSSEDSLRSVEQIESRV